jgi:dTDP-4-dehydrorhamnose reductase
MKKVLLLGSTGQLGLTLHRDISAMKYFSIQTLSADFNDLDGLRNSLENVAADIVINAAAYTAVDAAEDAAEHSRVMNVNAQAPEAIAGYCRAKGSLLVHFSTDYVYDGRKNTPYEECDATNPLNFYGHSKLEGDRLVAESGAAYLTFRVGWVYGGFRKNFYLTILRLARERKELRIVADQIGTPTHCDFISSKVLSALKREMPYLKSNSGLYNLPGPEPMSWYDFARRIILENNAAIGFDISNLHPISTSEYPLPAKRPTYTVMSGKKYSKIFG